MSDCIDYVGIARSRWPDLPDDTWVLYAECKKVSALYCEPMKITLEPIGGHLMGVTYHARTGDAFLYVKRGDA